MVPGLAGAAVKSHENNPLDSDPGEALASADDGTGDLFKRSVDAAGTGRRIDSDIKHRPDGEPEFRTSNLKLGVEALGQPPTQQVVGLKGKMRPVVLHRIHENVREFEKLRPKLEGFRGKLREPYRFH